MKKFTFTTFIAICLITTTGCSKIFAPTYPKEQIPSAIKRLCSQEYNITERIDVKIAGKTLGVKIHFDELLDIKFKLQEESLDKLQKLLKIIRRVCLSTDTDLHFYVIVGYEKKLGLEVVFYSYVDDLKKAVAGWMAPDDYFQRLIRTMQMDTLRWGNIRIDKLIKDIESRDMIKVIVNNFTSDIKISALNPDFLAILTDLRKKSHIRWNLSMTNSVPTASQERLYYIEAKEYFSTKIEEAEKLHYPSGSIHKFYILIEMDEMNPIIKNIYTIKTLPEKYIQLGSPDIWKEDDFFVEDFVFHEFLSTQIVQRVQFELSKEMEEKEEKISLRLEGNFIVKDKIDAEVKLTDPSKNIFKMSISAKKDTLKEIPQRIIDLSLKTIKDVCNKYKFYDIGEIQLVNNKGNIFLTIDKPSLFAGKWQH